MFLKTIFVLYQRPIFNEKFEDLEEILESIGKKIKSWNPKTPHKFKNVEKVKILRLLRKLSIIKKNQSS